MCELSDDEQGRARDADASISDERRGARNSARSGDTGARGNRREEIFRWIHALPPDIDGNITSGAGAARGNDLGRGSRSYYSTRELHNYS